MKKSSKTKPKLIINLRPCIVNVLVFDINPKNRRQRLSVTVRNIGDKDQG